MTLDIIPSTLKIQRHFLKRYPTNGLSIHFHIKFKLCLTMQIWSKRKMVYKTDKKKIKNRSFNERMHYIPKTYRYFESFFESLNKPFE